MALRREQGFSKSETQHEIKPRRAPHPTPHPARARDENFRAPPRECPYPRDFKTQLEPIQAIRGAQERSETHLIGKGSRTRAHVMAFLRSLSALLLALAVNTAAAQGSSSQPSFFLQDPSDGEAWSCAAGGLFPPCAVCRCARALCGYGGRSSSVVFLCSKR